VKRLRSRRTFLKQTMLSGMGFSIASCNYLQRGASPNEKLNIGIIGAGGKGKSDAKNAAKDGDNVVAICDVDLQRGAQTFKRFPKARIYTDYRVMLENEKLDAVTISTPDHHHYAATLTAMQLGLHVYCQKPLTHSPWEARQLLEASRRYKVATCMGNQGTAHDGLREAAEVVQSGAIGKVREAHVWTNRPVWPQGIARPSESQEVPATLHWDLWLGPAPERPYHKSYCPFTWRGWWDFGTGALGDMACHTANLTFLALKLGAPVAVEAETSGVNAESPPVASKICFEFPARGDLPPVKLFWYDGGNMPPTGVLGDIELPKTGSYLVGDKGILYSPDDYGKKYFLLPEEKFADFKLPPQTFPRSPGHTEEWLRACKGGLPALSNFEYAAPFTEAILLGNVALRCGRRIEWDSDNIKVTNFDEANQYVRRSYRKGWDVALT
jgi:predicted dehydrogenase